MISVMKSFSIKTHDVVALLMGAASLQTWIGAQAEAIAVQAPFILLAATFLANMLFFILSSVQPRFSRHFVNFAAVICVALVFMQILPLFFPQRSMARAMTWVAVAAIGQPMLRWVVSDAVIKSTMPSLIPERISRSMLIFEVGAFVTAPTSFVIDRLAGVADLSLLISFVLMSGATLTFVKFYRTRRYMEFRMPKEVARPQPSFWFTFLATCFFVLLLSSTARVVCQNAFRTFLAKTPDHMTTPLVQLSITYALGTFVALSLHGLLMHLTKRRPVDPWSAFLCHTTLDLFGAVVLWALPTSNVFMLSEGFGRGSERSLVVYGTSLLTNSLIGRWKIEFRSIIIAGTWLVPNLLGFLFSQIPFPSVQVYVERAVIFAMILCALGVVVVFLGRLASVNFFAHLARLSDSSFGILAVNMIGAMRAKGYEETVFPLVERADLPILRKTAIFVLGESDRYESIERLIHHFEDEAGEEIQVSIVHALFRTEHPAALSFLWRIVMNRQTVASFKVRIKAATLLSSMYGSEALPVLMAHLKDENPRVISSILEVLASHVDERFLPIILPYLEHDEPRVVGSALFALSKISSYRRNWQVMVQRLISKQDSHLTGACLFAVGRGRRRDLIPFIKATVSFDDASPIIRRSLASCLAYFDDPEATKMFYDLFAQKIVGEPSEGTLHLFSLLPSETRLNIIEAWIESSWALREELVVIKQALKDSRLLFDEELFLLGQVVGANVNLLPRPKGKKRSAS